MASDLQVIEDRTTTNVIKLPVLKTRNTQPCNMIDKHNPQNLEPLRITRLITAVYY